MKVLSSILVSCTTFLVFTELAREYEGLSLLTRLMKEATTIDISEIRVKEIDVTHASSIVVDTSLATTDDTGPIKTQIKESEAPALRGGSNNVTNNSTPQEGSIKNGPSSQNSNTLPSIVVQLQGRLGNYLGKLAQGYGLKLWLESEYGVKAKIVLRHQERPKWLEGYNDMVKCFPKAKDWDFSEANTDGFLELKKEQEEWLGSSMNPYTSNETEIRQILSNFTQFLKHDKARPPVSEKDIGLPFLHADKLSDLDIMVDRYYDFLEDLFEFDDACCKNKPDPDESVFVFRNFMAELPKVGVSKGFEELSPNKTAYELFGHLNAGDKIAILTTDRKSDAVNAYIHAFQERGLKARIVEPQAGIEDYCFLKSAKKELVGPARSTFVLWAGFLSECETVRPYSVNSEATRNWHQGKSPLEHYDFKHPRLAKRMKFELYDA